MLVTIFDGYVDEPSRLGVPPFISPYSRYAAGAIEASGNEYEYITIDQWRKGEVPQGQVLFIISNACVPGKYLRGMPASEREISLIEGDFNGQALVWKGENHDPDTMIFDFLNNGMPGTRRRTSEEWREWAISGANVIKQHPDFPQPLIAEIDLSYGCPRFYTGGCGFCTDVQYGEPVFREPEDIIGELKALLSQGVTNFRLGGQSCLFSYMTEELGESESPKPNQGAIKSLFKGISKLEGIRILHTDNANPSVMAEHPDEAKQILDCLVETCSSGNVLSLGMESADPKVIQENNLNAEPEQVMEAIRMVNKVGRGRGPNGMSHLLPGLNFVAGLDGETKETYKLNLEFLRKVRKEGLMLRRINIRQVASNRKEFGKSRFRKEFTRFKRQVREEIDKPMLAEMLPEGTILKDVYLEIQIGKMTYGRQIGTYPILIGLPYQTDVSRFVDVYLTSHGPRSVTGFEYPLNINTAKMTAINNLPGIGKKRAARILKGRPYKSIDELAGVLDEPTIIDDLKSMLSF